MKNISIQSGLSLIATILALLLFSLFIAVAVSLVTTGANIGVQETQGQQAFYIAEGGIEYVLANRTFPNYSLTTVTNLGAGSFTVASPTFLTADPGVAGTIINVQSTTNFPNTGRIIIDSELINYTATTATTFGTGGTPATRGVGGTTATAHAAGNAVYPATSVSVDPDVSGLTITVASTTGFVIPGVIKIDNEYIYCTSTNVPSTTQFTNCTRGYKGTSSAAHPAGSNVFQYIVSSTGTITSNPLANPTHRVVRISADRMGGEAVTNGTFPNGSLGSWPDASCPPNKQDGTVIVDMAATATADGTGSFRIQTQAGKKKTMNDCSQQTLAVPIPPSTPVTLRLSYGFLSSHTCGTQATCSLAIDFVYSAGPAQTVWGNAASYPAIWTTTGDIALTTNAGVNLTAVRISYNIESANVAGAQTTGWVDDISLTSAGNASIVSWREVVQ